MHDYANWDTTSDRYHHDGIIVAGNNNLANGVSYISIYNSTSTARFRVARPIAAPRSFLLTTRTTSTFSNVLVAAANQFFYNGLIFYWSPSTLQYGRSSPTTR